MSNAHTISPPAISIDNLYFAYRDDVILHDVSLRVEPGEFLAIIGPNGGGKTTLLRILLGFLAPQQGTVALFGQPPASMYRAVGYVPQFATLRQDFPASVLEMVLMGAALPRFGTGAWATEKLARGKALRHLADLGLEGAAHSPIGSLSGGQRQRALVARALMGQPDNPEDPFLLLLDEPTASIDPHGTFCFYEFLNTLRGQVTIVAVSHDLLLASPYFSHIAFVNHTLTMLPGQSLSPEALIAMFGEHTHTCPVGDWQHTAGVLHADGCTHGNCAGGSCDG